MPQAKVKAKAKGKEVQKVAKMPNNVQKVAEGDEAQKVAKKPKKAIAAAKNKAVAKAIAKTKVMRKPAGAPWDAWAHGKDAADDDDTHEASSLSRMESSAESEADAKDYSVPTKSQAYIFEQALKMEPGTRGSLPKEIHDLWATLQRGPGAVQERHALRNAIVPKDAKYGHVCRVDQNGPLMTTIRSAIEIEPKKMQVKGMSESDMLWKSFQGNEEAMQKAVQKGHIKVKYEM